jgi:hypothetical protein
MRQKAVESPTGGLRQLPSFVVVSESALSPLVSLAYGGPREAPSEDGVSRSASAAIIAVLNRARSASIPTRIHPTQIHVIRQVSFVPGHLPTAVAGEGQESAQTRHSITSAK